MRVSSVTEAKVQRAYWLASLESGPAAADDGDIDHRHASRYTPHVIQSFGDKRTQELYVTGRSHRLPPDLAGRALRKLAQLHAATSLGDLRVPPSNRLHVLTGDRKGQHSISGNDQWRICFLFQDGDAHDVEICDYH